MGFFSRRKLRAPLAPSQPAGPPPVPVDTRPTLPSSPPHQQPRFPPPRESHHYHAPQTSGVTSPGSSTTNSQPAAYSPPSSPPAWQTHTPPQQPPIVVNQHYYLLPAPPSTNAPQGLAGNSSALTRMVVGSAVNLTNHVMPGILPSYADDRHPPGSEIGSRLNEVCERFNDVMTLIDREKYCGNESKLFMCQRQSDASSSDVSSGGGHIVGKPKKNQSARRDRDPPRGQVTAVEACGVSGNYFAKVELYANSRLPMNLPPLKLYIPTWPLLCLAAEFSERAYEKARGKEREFQVDADLRSRMVIKSVPKDHMNTIVFAIRGTATFMDWAVNLRTESTSPVGFLDDYGNYCHAGFLSVARRMVKPVADRLRQLLHEDPGRRSYSLLITGHSAGGAVASLLYAHMLATSQAARSELNSLTGRFKRVHCVTFGTPPLSLLPLQKPSRPELKKSLFLSFVNEGDPVARADKAYVKSLLELFATPVPGESAALVRSPRSPTALILPGAEPRKTRSKSSSGSVKSGKGARSTRSNSSGAAPSNGPVWKVPPCTLSNAGKIVVLRSGDPKARLKGKKTAEERLNEGVVAQIATDEQLRTVVWGDPVCHLMKLYAGRVEMLAVNSVTAKDY